jgi:hypothetical protein
MLIQNIREKLHLLNNHLIIDRSNKSEDPFEDFKKIKSSLSGKGVAEKLGINEHLDGKIKTCVRMNRRAA